jgi:hypothetical protein
MPSCRLSMHISNYCNLSGRAEFEWDGQNLEILEYGSEAFAESNDSEAHLSLAMDIICKVLSTPVAIIHNVESIRGAQRSDLAPDDAAYQTALADVKAYASATNLEPRELYLSVFHTNNPISRSAEKADKKWQQKGDCSIISTIRIRIETTTSAELILDGYFSTVLSEWRLVFKRSWR